MKTIEEIRHQNLMQLIKDAGTQRAFSELIDKSYAQVNQWVNKSPDTTTGKPRVMSSGIAREIERKTGKPTGWMDIEHEKRELPFSNPSVEIYPLETAAPASHKTSPLNYLPLSQSWIDQYLLPISKVNNLRFIHAADNSMEPTLADGDILIVDTGTTSVANEGVYVLQIDTQVLLRRISKDITGGHIISNDNPVTRNISTVKDLSEIHILGKVLWAWSSKKI